MSQRHRKEKAQAKLAQAQSSEWDSRWEGQAKKWEAPVAAALGILSLAVYALTLNPGITGGDSAELITVACTGGVAHPPGYPLYTMLAKVMTAFPWGSVARRVNLLSALCDAAATMLLFLGVSRWSRSLAAGVVAAGLFAFSPTVWQYAVSAEVFALNNLAVAALLFLCVRYAREPRKSDCYLGALLIGLGVSNHHTFVFFALPAVVWILFLAPGPRLTPRDGAKLVGAGLLGLVPYGYLPWAGARSSLVSWGDPSTLEGALKHFFRTEYGTLKLSTDSSSGDLLGGVFRYFAQAPRELLYVGMGLAAFGLYRSFKREGFRGLALLTSAMFVAYVGVFHALANLPATDAVFASIYLRFCQQPNLMLFAWAGLGWAALTESRLPMKVSLAGAGALVALQLGWNYASQDQSRMRIYESFSESMLRNAPQNAIVLTHGDAFTNALRYAVLCEGKRSDLKILDRELLQLEWGRKLVERHYPDIRLPGTLYRKVKTPTSPSGAYDLKDFFAANLGRFPIYMRTPGESEDARWKSEYSLWPMGHLDLVTPKARDLSLQAYAAQSLAAISDFDPSRVFGRHAQTGYPSQTWETYLWDAHWELGHRRALKIYELAQNQRNLEGMKSAAADLEQWIRKHPSAPGKYWRNLGVMYRDVSAQDYRFHGKFIEALKGYLGTNPDPLTDPTLPQIRRLVGQAAN